ncbi:MAG: tripartite tricarboxylate transporter permease [Clostridium sp.]
MLSYVTAKNMSKHPEEFDEGCPDGVVATESANNATIGGAMIPLLVLGIPGDGVTAMMLGGFLIHGLSARSAAFREKCRCCIWNLRSSACCVP